MNTLDGGISFNRHPIKVFQTKLARLGSSGPAALLLSIHAAPLLTAIGLRFISPRRRLRHPLWQLAAVITLCWEYLIMACKYA